jgi:hypothetical protein
MLVKLKRCSRCMNDIKNDSANYEIKSTKYLNNYLSSITVKQILFETVTLRGAIKR